MRVWVREARVGGTPGDRRGGAGDVRGIGGTRVGVCGCVCGGEFWVVG